MLKTLFAGVCMFFASIVLVPNLSGDDKMPADKPEAVKPTIVFKGFEATENSKDTKITLKIEVEGSDHHLNKELGCAGSFPPEALVTLFDVVLTRDSSGWKFSADGNKGLIVIEGWTDPETKKFHSVKSIKFESKDLPKEYWPTIKMPPNL